MLTHKRKECLSYGRDARSQHTRVLLCLCDARYSTHGASLKLTSFNFLTGGRRVRNFNVSILTRAIFMLGFHERVQ